MEDNIYGYVSVYVAGLDIHLDQGFVRYSNFFIIQFFLFKNEIKRTTLFFHMYMLWKKRKFAIMKEG